LRKRVNGKYQVETEPPIMILLTMWRAGEPITRLNGKSQLFQEFQGVNGMLSLIHI